MKILPGRQALLMVAMEAPGAAVTLFVGHGGGETFHRLPLPAGAFQS